MSSTSENPLLLPPPPPPLQLQEQIPDSPKTKTIEPILNEIDFSIPIIKK
jgi:hypothetical protein